MVFAGRCSGLVSGRGCIVSFGLGSIVLVGLGSIVFAGRGCMVLFGRTAATGRITGAGAIPRSAASGLGVTAIAGRPLFTATNCARFAADSLANCTWLDIGGACGARYAATSAGVGRTWTPLGPPL